MSLPHCPGLRHLALRTGFSLLGVSKLSEIVDSYPLSPAQEGMLFHCLLEPEQGLYFEQRWCVLEGNLNVSAFQAAWQQVLARHDVLRASFHWQATDVPHQQVHAVVSMPVAVLDWQQYSESGFQEAFQQFLLVDREKGFTLNQAPLMRCALLKRAQNRYQLVWSYHHLLMDGWCNGVVIGELLQLYHAENTSVQANLPQTNAYRHFIDWLQLQDANAAKQFWQGELSNLVDKTDIAIPTVGTVSNAPKTENHKEFTHTLNAQLTEQLQLGARQQRLTLNTLVQAAWAVWLARSGDQSDVVFGAALANRPPSLAGVDTMVGLFINTVPVRAKLDFDTPILEWLHSLQKHQRQREQFGWCGLRDIQNWMDNTAHTFSPLFDSILVFENYPFSSAMALAGQQEGTSSSLQISDAAGYEQTHYPLAIMVIPNVSADGEAPRLSFCVRYDTQRFSDTGIQLMLDQLQHILNDIISCCTDTAAPEKTLAHLSLITPQQVSQLTEWGQGQSLNIPDTAIPQQISQVAQQGLENAIALTYIDDQDARVSLTYCQLNAQVEQLSDALERNGVRAGDRVGVCLAREYRLPIALIAIMKLGAAYVPLDPDYPQQRLEYVAKHAQLSALVVSNETNSLWGEQTHNTLTFNLDTQFRFNEQASPGWNCNQHQRDHRASADDLAYIIYTSGSTGNPKGVPIAHGSLNNFLYSMASEPGITPEDKLLAVTTVSFDISILEMFLPLVTGATLVFAHESIARDANHLARIINEENISIMQASPATWRLLRESQWQGKPDLKILCGGEVLEVSLGQWMLPRCGELWNMYGPTETTIWSAALQVLPEHMESGSVPVGGPIANTQLLVLDSQLNPVPCGTAGDLYIAGEGLSPGYWQQPELTEKAFIHARPLVQTTLNTHSQKTHQTLYRTGDRVRWRSDGLLGFLGRADHQVKLRGFRIEPGEIEAVLNRDNRVAGALVQLRTDQPADPRLVLYMVFAHFSDDTEADLEDLKRILAEHVPGYMLPSDWVVLAEWPLTPNGKIDRKALPAPEALTGGSTRGKTHPSTALQEVVATSWIEVLGIQGPIYLEDDFFHLGGHSLLATRMIGHLQQVLSKDVQLKWLFEASTLGAFCERIQLSGDSGEQANANVIPIHNRQGDLPLSWAQRRQWLLQQLNPNSSAYLIPVALRLRGQLNESALEHSLQTLVARHETLRQSYRSVEGEPLCQVMAPTEAAQRLRLQVQNSDSGSVSIANVQKYVAHQCSQAMDLAEPPLVRAQLLTAQEDSVLILVVHHIAVDDWSLGLLVNQLTQLYNNAIDGVVTGTEPQPEPESKTDTIQYIDYAAWQQQQNYDSQLTYWCSVLESLPEPLNLPYKNRNAVSTTTAAERIHIKLEPQLIAALKAAGNKQGSTLYMTLLTGFYLLLSRYSQNQDIVLATPVANRHHAAVQPIVGLFVNTLLLRMDLSKAISISELHKLVRQRVLAAFDNQDVPFEKLLHNLPQLRSTSGEPTQVLFALQGAELEKLELGGVDWQPIDLEPAQAKFELNLSLRYARAMGNEQAIEGFLEYRADLFSKAMMQQFADHFSVMLAHIVDPPAEDFRLWPLLSADQLNWVSEHTNGPNVSQRQTICDAFQDQVAACSNHTAIIDQDRVITYAELDLASNQLAHLLLSLHVEPDTPIGIWAERGWHGPLFMLAILKAGACFVPLDPKQPLQRLQTIAQTTGLTLILSPEEGIVPDIDDNCVELPYTLLFDELNTLPNHRPTPKIEPQNLAYIMFTSGSTGVPKGVAVPHQAVTRLVCEAQYVELNQHTRMLQAAPLAFDAATFEIWGALLNGGQLIVQSGSELVLKQTADLILKHQINVAWFTAGLMQVMVDEHLAALVQLKQLLAGGDVLSVSHLAKLQQAAPQLRIINGYGPTETTTFACCHSVQAQDLLGESIPIGRPISETAICILDEHMQWVPPGVEGELYITGRGTARGYFNQPDNTANSFVPNPYVHVNNIENSADSLQLYRTGDLVKLNESGYVEFLGRKDNQLKIRGHRVETTEIELAILKLSSLERVYIDGVEVAGRKQIVVWYLDGGTNQPIDVNALKKDLFRVLPEYMVPTIWIPLSNWPLTLNGKLDRKALPDPAQQRSLSNADSPQQSLGTRLNEHGGNNLESSLLQLWQSLFPGVSVSLVSNFFELGGDSIVAMQLESRALRLGLPFKAKMIFEYPSIQQLAQHIELNADQSQVNWQAADQNPTGEVSLTPIQRWFFSQDFPYPDQFNQALMLRMPVDIDVSLLQTALTAVIAKHDAFRLQFKESSNGWHAEYGQSQESQAPIEVIDVSDSEQESKEIDKHCVRLQKNINIQNGPLIRVGFFMGSQQAGLFIAIHHLVVDGVSWRVIMADLYQAWQQLSAGHGVALGPKPYSLQQYGEQLLSTEVSAQDAFHWQAFEGYLANRMPTELASNNNCYGSVARVRRNLNGPATQQLLGQQAYSLADALVVLVGRELCCWSGLDSLVVNMESHGRTAQDTASASYHETVGWFTDLFPVLVHSHADADLSELRNSLSDRSNVNAAALSFGVLQGIQNKLPQHYLGNVAINYLGVLDTGLGGAEGFQREPVHCDLVHPENPRFHVLEVNAWVESGELVVEWSFSRHQYQVSTIATLADNLLINLEAFNTESDSDGDLHFGLNEDDVMAALSQVEFGQE